MKFSRLLLRELISGTLVSLLPDDLAVEFLNLPSF